MDLTNELRIEKKVFRSEKLFPELFDNMLNGFAFCKMLYLKESRTDFIYLKVNRAFESLTGLKNVKGKKVSEVIPGIQKSDPLLINTFSRVALTGKPEMFETYVESLKMWFLISVYCPEKEYFIAVFDVITRRKEAEEALIESERKFHDTVIYLDEGFYSVTTDGVLLEHNQAFNRIMGFAETIDLKGTHLPDFWQNPEERITYLKELTLNDSISNYQINAIKHTGEKIIVLASSHLVKDKVSNTIRIEGVFLDITDRKRAEEALHESQVKYRELFENAQVGMYRSKLDGSALLAVNSKLCEIFGYSEEEMLSNPATIRWAYPHSRDRMVKNLQKTGFLQDYLIDILTKNGNIRTCLVSIKLHENKGYIEGSAVDITERMQAEDALRLKNFVFDASIAANSISDINGIITEANNAFLRLWGYQRRDEIIGKPITHFLQNPDEAGIIVCALNSTGEWEGNYTARRKDGSTFIAYGLATVVKDDKGNGIGYQSSVLDVTHAKAAEETIRSLNEDLEQRVIQRTEQLKAANNELEAFSYSVSHDLRAPLRAVHAYTKILLEEYENKIDDEGKRICGIISSSATQMGGLIDDLLSFSRIGRNCINANLLDMKLIARSVFEELSGEKVTAKSIIKIGRLHNAHGDPTLIRHIWTNLLSNAIKYSSKEEFPKISIGSRVEENSIIYFVKDNGVGFDMQYIHKLYGVFQRLHSGNEFEGNGVGLAIVQRVVTKHGGHVWAESAVGKGATFYFSLPAERAESQAPGYPDKVVFT